MSAGNIVNWIVELCVSCMTFFPRFTKGVKIGVKAEEGSRGPRRIGNTYGITFDFKSGIQLCVCVHVLCMLVCVCVDPCAKILTHQSNCRIQMTSRI